MRTRQILKLGALGVLLLFAAVLVDHLHLEYRKVQARNQVATFASSAASTMTNALNQRLSLVRGLSAFVTVKVTDGSPDQLEREFPSFAAAYFPQVPGIRNLAVAPDFVVRLVYPTDPGNLKVIGNDILQDKRPGFADAVRRAIQSRGMAVHEPVELIQGGLGLLARQAIFVGDRPWGAVGIVFNISALIESSRVGTIEGQAWALRTTAGKLIGGDPRVFDNAPEIARIDLPEGYWEFAMCPNAGWKEVATRSGEVAGLRAFLAVLAIAVMALAWSQMRQRQTLEQLIETRTKALADAAAFAREISHTKQRLTEAQHIAQLGFVELDGPSRSWVLGTGAREVLDLGEKRDTGELAGYLANVASEDRHRLLDSISSGKDGDYALELRVAEKTLLARWRYDGEAPEIITFQDISQRKVEESERAKMIERLSESSRLEALGTLAGGVAHEINTPAQFIGDNLAFLKTWLPRLLSIARQARLAADTGDWSALSAEAAAFKYEFAARELPAATDQALEGINRIASIVAAIKEFSYPSEKMPRPFDLNRAVELAATVTTNQWKHVAELRMNLDQRLPALNAIEGEINQVLINLIVNAVDAIKASDRFPGRIDIATRLIADAVELSIADTGLGVPAAIQDKIFELFFTTKPPGQGTGQGLAIIRAIVLRHDGTITVDSEPGNGACFILRLPVDRSQAGAG